MLLSGKTILVTGANRGIGRAIAIKLSNEGAKVVLCGRNVVELERLKEFIQKDNPLNDTMVLEMDVSKYESIKQAFLTLSKSKIVLDGIVNNAGVMKDAALMMTSEMDVRQMFETNTFGTIYCCQFAVKNMLKQRKGSILNLSSIVGVNGSSGQSVYSASKSAILGFTKSLSKEIATFNIRVNAMSPGFIETDMTAGKSDEYYERNLLNIPLKRFGSVEDVSNLAVFMMSDNSSYITGQIIGVDGGMII